MSIKDVLKNSFLENIGEQVPTRESLVVCLMIAFLLGCYIYFIYWIMTSDTFYSKGFNTSLILVTVITASIILTIQSSVVVSLGMVGALSIVRFRTAVKEPMDLAFLFWAISGGIMAGTGMVELIIFLSVIITIIVVLYCMIPKTKKPIILLSVSTDSGLDIEEIKELLVEYDSKYHIQSRNLTGNSRVYTVEMKTKDPDALMKNLMDIKGVSAVSAVSNKGNVI